MEIIIDGTRFDSFKDLVEKFRRGLEAIIEAMRPVFQAVIDAIVKFWREVNHCRRRRRFGLRVSSHRRKRK